MSRRRDAVAARLQELLFTPVSARAAARFRAGLGVLVPVVFWSVGAEVDRDLAATLLADLYESVFGTWWYSAAVVAVSVAFGASLRTRWTGPVLVVLLVPLVAAGTGQQSRQVLLTAVVGVALLRERPAPGAAGVGPMWPIRLIQAQVTILYLFNAAAKATPGYLRGDVLVGLSAMRPNFLVDLTDRHVGLAGLELPVRAAAMGSVAVELFVGIALWHHRLRWVAAAVGVTFHLALTRVVDIHLLGVVSVFLYLAFLLDWQVRSDGWRGWRCRR